MATECLRVSPASFGAKFDAVSTSAASKQVSNVKVGKSQRRSTTNLSSSLSNSFTGLSLPYLVRGSKSSAGASSSRRAAAGGVIVQAVDNKNVLIINTNSGGHAVIGFWLAKQLRTWPHGHSVTILTVGKEDDSKMRKPPFSKFEELRIEGVHTIWGNPSNVAAAVGDAKFDVVVDNNGKDLESVKPVIDWAKSKGTKQFLFISSAGIYKGTEEPPHLEGDPVKADAGHVQVEEYLNKAFPKAWASFRPQYITGAYNNKDCEEWFFDRLVRGRPVPIPGSGMQMTVIAPVYDMASMLVAAIENPSGAAGGVFNCVGDRAVTFDGLVRMCARAAGVEAEIVHYNPEKAGVDVKKAFPFRNMHFYSEPRAAKVKLEWKPVHDLQEVLNSRFRDYIQSGRDKNSVSFDLDEKILRSVRVPARSW